MIIPTLIPATAAAPQAPSPGAAATPAAASGTQVTSSFSDLLNAPAPTPLGTAQGRSAPKNPPSKPAAGAAKTAAMPPTPSVKQDATVDSVGAQEAAATLYAGWLAAAVHAPIPALGAATPQKGPSLSGSSVSPMAAPTLQATALAAAGKGTGSAPGPASEAAVPPAKLAVAAPAAPSVPTQKAGSQAAVAQTAGTAAAAAPAKANAAESPAAAAGIALPQALQASAASADLEQRSALVPTKTVPVGGAKIAAAPEKDGASKSTTVKVGDKKIQNGEEQSVTESSGSIGTAVAKVTPTMPSSFQSDRQPNTPAVSSVAMAGAASSGSAPADSQAPAQDVSSVHSAVEAALQAAESFTRGNAQSVNLQFSVGDADLSLRVELRSGEVHTTFRTDSAELRGDLANAWQSVNTAGIGVKMAEPVFTSSDSHTNLSSGNQASQERSLQDRSFSSQASGNSPASFSMGSSTAVAEEPSERAPAALATSLHLQAFA